MHPFVRSFLVAFLTLCATQAFTACGGLSDESADNTDNTSSINQELGTSSIQISSYDLMILSLGDYTMDGYLRYSTSRPGIYTGGSNLSARYKQAISTATSSGTINGTQTCDTSGWYCGQCVSLVKSIASRYLAATARWVKGNNVMAARNIPVGTIIATFRNGYSYDQYGNDHTAIFAGYSGNGIVVYDQNYGNPALRVRYHAISSTSGSGPGNAAAFYTVLVP